MTRLHKPVTSIRLPATRCARQPLYWWRLWMRQPKEMNMKRLLRLLLVVWMVGGGDDVSPAG
ncbi:MAG: hypothetical protein MK364_07885, partial [Pirellulales bacterium]|nr:hypothetical protein [Pirellulales bacterium]